MPGVCFGCGLYLQSARNKAWRGRTGRARLQGQPSSEGGPYERLRTGSDGRTCWQTKTGAWALRSRCLTAWQERCYFLQDSLTISTLVAFRCPCSLASASTASLAFSLAPCISGCQTLPLTVTVCPRCGESLTVALVTSHVLPSSPVTLNSLALSPFDRQPVMLRTSSLLSWLGAACAAKTGERIRPDATRSCNDHFAFISPSFARADRPTRSPQFLSPLQPACARDKWKAMQ